PRYYRTFYLRRAARIVPLYAVLLLLFAVRYQSGEWPIPLASYATYTQNFFMAWEKTLGHTWLSPTWSLAIEEQFYLTLPLLVRWVPPRRLWVALLGLFLLGPASRIGLVWAAGERLGTFA